MEWISAEDRLPKGERILFVSQRYYGTGYYTPLNDGYWETDDGIEIRDVTHWMPLPDPPMEKSDE